MLHQNPPLVIEPLKTASQTHYHLSNPRKSSEHKPVITQMDSHSFYFTTARPRTTAFTAQPNKASRCVVKQCN